MIGIPLNPGWAVPSIVTVSLIMGSCDPGVIVNGAEPGMLKLIVSAPAFAFAALIASLNVQPFTAVVH